MEHVLDFLNSNLGHMLILAVLSLHLIGKSADFIAQAVAKVPFVGSRLAELVRALGGDLENYLKSLPGKADVAVQAAEESYRSAPSGVASQAKLEDAISQLKKAAPGLSDAMAKAQIEAALTRMRANFQEQKSATPGKDKN